MASPAAARMVSAFLLALGISACGERAPKELPRYGEVVVSIDTDAPVPGLIGRLRVDIFDTNGRWLESRDVARNNPSDWPATFSLYSEDETKPSQMLVRARGYLQGRVRDYHGEVFQERTPYVEPPVADTLTELCAALPPLTLGQDRTLRAGTRPLTGVISDSVECWRQPSGGVAAARLMVAAAGEYRIETTRAGALDTILSIRSDCQDPRSQLACNDDISRDPQLPNFRSRLTMHLEPGSYTVLAGTYAPAAVDLTLRADLATDWDTAGPALPTQGLLGSAPRLVVNGVDETPAQEPQPLVTIDRLALFTVVPKQKQQASVVLRTACGGQMAKLSATANNAAPVIAEAETCVDAEGQRVPITPEPQTAFSAAISGSLVGSFSPVAACASSAGTKDAVCIPGGAFVFGSPLYTPYPSSTTPERFALMDRYWLDRTEVTVGRWRSAVAKGLDVTSKSSYFMPVRNDAPLDAAKNDDLGHCTYSLTAASAGEPREDHPVNCVDWPSARAFCQFEGGDLPTEAQWQYAASKAGRSVEVDDFCALGGSGLLAPACHPALSFPVAVTDPAVAADVTPLGVRDLLGNVSELTLDSFQALDSPCWDGSTLLDPVCWERNAPARTIVGGDWSSVAPIWRIRFEVDGVNGAVGFRCAYHTERK